MDVPLHTHMHTILLFQTDLCLSSAGTCPVQVHVPQKAITVKGFTEYAAPPREGMV